MKCGFDSNKYYKLQSKTIKERFKLFDKLYLEVGGKLFDDYHAARVLSGFKADSKINMFKELKDDLEIIICISANAIEKNKVRAEYDITYDLEVIRLINNFRNLGFLVNSVVITLYNHQSSTDKFIKRLEKENIKTYIHTYTKGYPTDVDTIVSEEGYGANPYIETSKRLVIVTAPGPGSGKLATCLSQLYHERKRCVNAGYAKYETFPVWNLPLKHPVNMAYEAATADLKDVNMIDSFHLKEYGIVSTSYNRDLEIFPVVKEILYKITGENIYLSPTDMGVNKIGFAIKDNDKMEDDAKKEIVRRYLNEYMNYKLGLAEEDVPNRIKVLMNELKIDDTYLKVVNAAREKADKVNSEVVAIELKNGKIITGKETKLLSATSSAIINTIKYLTKIPDEIDLLSPSILEPILKNRIKDLDNSDSPLKLREVMIALSICSVTNPSVEKALNTLSSLEGCEVHSTYIMLGSSDYKMLKNLKMNVTCSPYFYLERKKEELV